MNAIEAVGNFFQKILAGENHGVSESDKIATLSPLLGMALAKGNLPAALSVADKFLRMPNTELFQATAGSMKPMLKNLASI